MNINKLLDEIYYIVNYVIMKRKGIHKNLIANYDYKEFSNVIEEVKNFINNFQYGDNEIEIEFSSNPKYPESVIELAEKMKKKFNESIINTSNIKLLDD